MQFLVEDDHDERNFEGSYNGLTSRNQAGPFFGLYPHGMPLTKESEAKIRSHLELHELINPGDPLPQRPEVEKYLLKQTEKRLWMPTMPLNELRDRIWEVGIKAVAREQRTNEPWLSAVLRALRVPVPPPGRSNKRKHPEQAEMPPHLTDKSDEEIALIIKQEHGVAPAAKKLGLPKLHLYAWCVVQGVKVPSKSELGRYWNVRERVRAHREEVRRLLKNSSLENVAQSLNVSDQCLERFCEKNGIHFFRSPPPPPPPPPGIVEQIRRELALNARRPRDESEAMAWVLSRGTGQLTEPELASAINAAFGLWLTTETIAHAADQNPIQYEHRNGTVRLVGHYKAELDITALKFQLDAIAKMRTQWSLQEALRQALALTFGGLGIEQLAELLPIFGIELGRDQLHQELKRLDRQHRINLDHGRVTASEVPFEFRRCVRDREPTPGFEQICERVKTIYEAIVEQPLTNLEKMRLILREAPNGLWQEEIALAASTAGIDLQKSAIECVPGHEGKGELKRNHGRVEMLVDKNVFVKKSQLKAVLRETKNLDRMGLMLKLLEAFPAGLSMHELGWACRENGDEVSIESFERWIYNHQDSHFIAQKGRVFLCSAPAQNSIACSGPVEGTTGVGPHIAKAA